MFAETQGDMDAVLRAIENRLRDGLGDDVQCSMPMQHVLLSSINGNVKQVLRNTSTGSRQWRRPRDGSIDGAGGVAIGGMWTGTASPGPFVVVVEARLRSSMAQLGGKLLAMVSAVVGLAGGHACAFLVSYSTLASSGPGFCGCCGPLQREFETCGDGRTPAVRRLRRAASGGRNGRCCAIKSLRPPSDSSAHAVRPWPR